MRSYTGWQRKLKCDEAKPVCGQCSKGPRDCIFAERSVFRSFEAENGGTSSTGTSSPLFGDEQTWIAVPRRLTFVRVGNPYEPDTGDLYHSDIDVDVEGDFDKLPSTGSFDEVPRDDMSSVVSNYHRQDCQRPSPSPRAASSPTPESPRESFEDPVEANILAFRLLQHFRKGPGQWMDVFDTGGYFSNKVPMIATSRPLLKSAVCALSSKHLQHLQQGSRIPDRHSPSQQSPTRAPWFVANDVDWAYQAARYYHRTIGCLKDTVDSRRFESSLSDKEELFAAIAILCIYELMDAPGTAWRAHLSALPLFHPAPDPESTPFAPVAIPQAPIKGPIFWNLARQDLLCAFISETPTRLDLRDKRLWQNAGLATDERGSLLPFNPLCSADVHTVADVEEDTRSNELTWLLGKIANHLTSGDALTPEDYALPPGQRLPIGVTQEQLLERWGLLTAELQKWHESLPASFAASARRPVPTGSRTDRRDGAFASEFQGFEQIWYEVPICAATMQSYHMACILLLVNRPQESTVIRSTVSARLKCYRHIMLEVRRHAREICGISLADPPDPVRIHSVQPLFVAGQVFHETREQDAVLNLLAGIERDLGWTTSYHAKRLVGEWPCSRDAEDATGERASTWIFR